jgi:bacterioferritin-associated ferredoxin
VYACLCRAVPERRVREVVAAGATTIAQVRESCGAGTGCGGCLPSLRRLLRECLGTDLSCTAAAVLDGGSRTLLQPACSGNCAEVPEAGGAPTCVAGLTDCDTCLTDDHAALAAPSA